jgi:hypothetical protein
VSRPYVRSCTLQEIQGANFFAKPAAMYITTLVADAEACPLSSHHLMQTWILQAVDSPGAGSYAFINSATGRALDYYKDVDGRVNSYNVLYNANQQWYYSDTL